jgi:hypothetical protein
MIYVIDPSDPKTRVFKPAAGKSEVYRLYQYISTLYEY